MNLIIAILILVLDGIMQNLSIFKVSGKGPKYRKLIEDGSALNNVLTISTEVDIPDTDRYS